MSNDAATPLRRVQSLELNSHLDTVTEPLPPSAMFDPNVATTAFGSLPTPALSQIRPIAAPGSLHRATTSADDFSSDNGDLSDPKLRDLRGTRMPLLIPLFDDADLSFRLPKASEAGSVSLGLPDNLTDEEQDVLIRKTRRDLEDRLRLLKDVEATLGQCVSDLTRALATDSEAFTPSTAVDHLNRDKGKQAAEGVHAAA